MTDGTAQAEHSTEAEPQTASDAGDRKADAKAVIVIFVAATLMAITYISGFSFDFN